MPDQSLSNDLCVWLRRNRRIKSAVLFGSTVTAIANKSAGSTADYSDFDIHIIISDPNYIKPISWSKELGRDDLCAAVIRPASGSVVKLTAIFSSGQIDLILVPYFFMQLARIGYYSRLHSKFNLLATALNEMATCLRTGYLFLKGEKDWGNFYEKISALPGVRLTASQIRAMADGSVCDMLWVLQKIKSGELVAAQHVLHSKIVDANLRLWREYRIRNFKPLPSFGLGRRLEQLAETDDLSLFPINSRCNIEELTHGVWVALEGLRVLMGRLDPNWRIAPAMTVMWARFR